MIAAEAPSPRAPSPAAPAPFVFRPPVPAPLRERPDLARLLLALRRNPLETWQARHFEEPVVADASPLGRTLTVSDPAGVRRVLVDNAANYAKDGLQRRVLAPGLGDGLLTAEGEAWRRARRTLAPLFTPRRVDGFARRMRAVADARVDRWLRRRPEMPPLDAAGEMTRVTFDVLADTLFSGAVEGEALPFERAMTRYIDGVGRIDPLDLLGAPAWIPRVGRITAKPALAFFEARVTAIVAARRKLMAEAGDDAPDDLLTALLRAADPETGAGLTELEVGANVVTFITAGHETTARALAWTLHLLANDPARRERLEAEARTAPDDPAAWPDALPFARACLEEAMRLFPPVPFMSRAALAPDEVAGHRVTTSTLVVIAPYVLHRHARLWDDPAAFRPERFLPGAREGIDRFAYLPFGAGPRVCIGARFALMEAVIVLASIARRARLEDAGGADARPLHRITLRPEGALPMRARALA